ncbi:MAG TPA: DUF2577 domain-containing protein [Candidatus Blautia faecipullorum]|nr:DUF2577 domain-containing protein [Candidatus Blautia faecipullorum]
MNDKTSLKQIFQEMSGYGMPDIVKAVVISMSPLKMELVEDKKIILTEKSLIIPPARKWRMKEGIEYYLLCFNKQHVYYVLDRVKEYEDNG